MAAQYPVKQPSDQDFPANVADGYVKRNAGDTGWEEVAAGLVGAMAAEGVAAANAAGTANAPARIDHVHARAAADADAYAEMYVAGGAVATNIETASIPVALMPLATGLVSSAPAAWTFGVGAGNAIGNAISAFADYGGTVPGTVQATTGAAHNLTTGDYVGIRGTTNYNGIFQVTVIDATSFYFTDTWVADDATGDIDLPDRLIAGTGAAGKYLASVYVEWTTGGADTHEFAVYVNGTAAGNLTHTVANGGRIVMSGLLTIAEGDWVYLVATSNGTGTLTVVNADLSLVRV